MPRRNLIRTEFYPYHVVNQANNQEWFELPPPYLWELFSNVCYEISILCEARIHAFVMMSNHYHLIISSPVYDLGTIMKHFGSSATRSYNLKTGRVGHLFRGKYRWSLIDSPLYYAHALKYVYRNPVKAGLSERVEDYSFSTLHGLLGLSPLPFPLFMAAREQFNRNFIPQNTENLLQWLNTPYKNEETEALRKALRRRVFQFPVYKTIRGAERLESGLV